MLIYICENSDFLQCCFDIFLLVTGLPVLLFAKVYILVTDTFMGL